MPLSHPCLLSPLSSDEDTKAKSCIIAIIVINALIWSNFGKKHLELNEVAEVKGGHWVNKGKFGSTIPVAQLKSVQNKKGQKNF